MKKKEIEAKLKSEGFQFVSYWKDAPHTVYPEHVHQDKVVLCALSGSISMIFKDHTEILVSGSRFDVPPKTQHRAVVGPEGFECIYGEMIEGDA